MKRSERLRPAEGLAERILKVNHAGEHGAINIYAGQLFVARLTARHLLGAAYRVPVSRASPSLHISRRASAARCSALSQLPLLRCWWLYPRLHHRPFRFRGNRRHDSRCRASGSGSSRAPNCRASRNRSGCCQGHQRDRERGAAASGSFSQSRSRKPPLAAFALPHRRHINGGRNMARHAAVRHNPSVKGAGLRPAPYVERWRLR